jgi:hypothetical protein
MALTPTTIGASFSAANNLSVDVVIPGLLVWLDSNATTHSVDLGSGGGWGVTTFAAPNVTEIVSFSGSANGFWYS